MEPNIPSDPRMCDKCNVKSAVAWYTKRGRMNVFCMKCGKTWEMKYDNRKKDGP